MTIPYAARSLQHACRQHDTKASSLDTERSQALSSMVPADTRPAMIYKQRARYRLRTGAVHGSSVKLIAQLRESDVQANGRLSFGSLGWREAFQIVVPRCVWR